MRICFIDVLGLTYDGSTLLKRGLGGSESAIILLSRELTKIGFDVTVFNDCESDDSASGVYDSVLYKPLRAIEEDYKFDIMIGSRSIAAFAPRELRNQFKTFSHLPDFTNIQAHAKHKVLYMHDTFCDGDNLIEDYVLEGRINSIFTLSDWHTAYISHADHGKRRNYDILKPHIFMTRNGIGDMNIDWVDIKEKDPNLFVFNASVTKGMIPLVKQVWPKVQQLIPAAKLKVIGGYYRFRSDHGPDQQELDWRQMVEDHPNIEFTGIISQQEISSILRKASYMIYPAGFPETFGISTLEALAHNVPIITCRFGALEETAIDIASYKIPYPIEPNWAIPWLNQESQVNIFVDAVTFAYNNKYLHQQKMYACNQIKDVCRWDSIALQWKQYFYKVMGDYLPVEEYRKVHRINAKVKKVFNRRFNNVCEYAEPKYNENNKIKIISPVYNGEKYIVNCIKSVIQQNYNNYEMTIIDDASTDNTFLVANNYINSLPDEVREKIVIVKNEINRGALCNQIDHISRCEPNDIVMLLDGDDWLINDPSIFDKYNNTYNDGAEFTYGSCWSLIDNIPLVAQEYPPYIRQHRKYRDYMFNWNMPYTHLRTFKAYLFFNHVNLHGYNMFLDDNGEYYKAGGDGALFYALIEAADPEKVICVPDIVYNYNDINPLCDYKVNGEEQNKNARAILSRGNTTSPFAIGQYDLRPL